MTNQPDRLRNVLRSHEKERGEGDENLQLARIALEWGLVDPTTLADGGDLARLLAPEVLERVRAERTRRSSGGASIRRFELKEMLGQGGMGTVYRAIDREIGRPVAIKFLRIGPAVSETASARFQREARVAAGVVHPNVVKMYDAFQEDLRMVLVMEFVEGKSLTDLLAAGLDVPGGVALLEKAARGVDELHRQGIVHRDLKPANVLVTKGNEPKIADFGLAKLLGSDTALTRTGAAIGTPLYMSPEQVLGRQDDIGPPTDVYALGAMLYELLTRHAPHEGETAAIFHRILEEDPVRPREIDPTIPATLEAITLKALAKDPRRRYATAGAFADDLLRFLEGKEVRVSSPGKSRSRARRPTLTWVAIPCFMALLASGAYFLVARRQAETRVALQASTLSHRLSTAYFDLRLKTLIAMKELEDYCLAAGPAGSMDPRLNRIEKACGEISATYDVKSLPQAWHGLALYFAGRKDEAWKKLDAAAREAGDDPYPMLVSGYAYLHAYLDTLICTATTFSGPEARPCLFESDQPDPGFEAKMVAALNRAIANPVLKQLDQGREYKALADGVVRFSKRDYAAAVPLFKSLGTDPMLGDISLVLAGIASYLCEDYPGAIAALEQPAARAWPVAVMHRGLARMMLASRTGDAALLDRATADFQAAMRQLPHVPEIRVHVGIAFWLKAVMEESAGRTPEPPLLQVIETLTPKAADRRELALAHLFLGLAHGRMARVEHDRKGNDLAQLDRSIEEFTRYIRMSPGDVTGYLNRATSRLLRQPTRKAEVEEILEDLDQVVRVNSKSWEALGKRGRVYALLGRYPEGLADAEESLRLNPDQPDIREMIERIHRAMK